MTMKQAAAKRKVVFTVVFVLLSQLVFAQAKTDSIDYKKKWWGYAWIKYQGKDLTKMREYTAIMKPDPIASGYLNKAKQNQKIDLILDNSGLICLIVSGLTYNTSRDKHSSFSANSSYLGLALIGVSVRFTISANHNFWKAIKTYNSDLRMTGHDTGKP